MDRRRWGCLFEVLETLVLTIVIFLLIQNFVAQPYQVEQESMENTLQPGQYVLVDKLTPRFNDYQRGDIIVFNPPGQAPGSPAEVPFIKRIIGLPGDRIDFRNGDVYVNGVKLDEPYLYGDQPTQAGAMGSTVVVPADSYFGMGDHRADSTDSRVFGFIARSDIIGRAWLRYWPITDLGILSAPTYANVPPPGSALDPGIGLAALSLGLGTVAAVGSRALRTRVA
ncbi:MAG: signal peptidase I [Candidatus Limnocylindrales bacterium]